MNTNEELKALQSLPLDVKIVKTQQRIREWVDVFGIDGCYVSRSGGKDSDVLGDIVRKMYPEIPHVFVNTGLEYDSVRKHATEECDTVLRPEMNFMQVIKKYGYPVISKEVALKVYRIQCKPDSAYLRFFDGSQKGKSVFDVSKYRFLLNAPFRISHMCCDIMKKKPAAAYEKQQGKTPFIGVMADESRTRKTKWLKNGCNAFEQKKPQSNPLSFWTEQDILLYIARNNLKIADVYGDIVYRDSDGMEYENPLFDSSMKLDTTGAKRTGCVFCMFGITKDTERFLRLKENDYKKYDFVIRGASLMKTVSGCQIKDWDISSLLTG